MKDILRKQNSKNPYIAKSLCCPMSLIDYVQAFGFLLQVFQFCNQELMQIE
jgi:hypothetical protein